MKIGNISVSRLDWIDNQNAWHRTVDFVTVYSKEDILFNFKDGTEIQS